MIENIRKGENKLDFSKFVFVDQWKMKVRIGDLTKIRTGKLDANAASMDGQYPFFTCSKEPLRISTYSYDCECVLVAGNGDLNVKYYNGKFDAYQRTYIIENNNVEKLYLPYLYYFLETYIEELRKQAIGGVIKYIKICRGVCVGGIDKRQLNKEHIEDFPIICPPTDMVNEYVKFVCQVDKSKLLSLIKLLEQLITYLYNVFIIYRQDKGEEVERHE